MAAHGLDDGSGSVKAPDSFVRSGKLDHHCKRRRHRRAPQVLIRLPLYVAHGTPDLMILALRYFSVE